MPDNDRNANKNNNYIGKHDHGGNNHGHNRGNNHGYNHGNNHGHDRGYIGSREKNRSSDAKNRGTANRRSADPAPARQADRLPRYGESRSPYAPYSERFSNRQEQSRGAYSGSGGRYVTAEREKLPPVRGSAPSGRSRAAGIIKLSVITLAVLFGLYYITVMVTLSGVNVKKTDTNWEDRPASAVSGVPLESGSVSDIILLIGADDDGGSGSRSDTIMYVSINRLTGKVRLCSVLRDCYVEIPGYRPAKINAAFAFGSDELCMRTMESNFRIRTQKFIRVNMQALITAIDTLGGVELELSADEAKAMNSHFAPGTAVEGKQNLGGQYAVYFARIRKTDDDFHRVSRQRTLISAIGKKCVRSSPLKVCSAANKASRYVTTNISPSKLSGLGMKIAVAMSTGNCEQMTVPADGTWSYQQIDGQSCIKMDVGTNARIARDFLLYKD